MSKKLIRIAFSGLVVFGLVSGLALAGNGATQAQAPQPFEQSDSGGGRISLPPGVQLSLPDHLKDSFPGQTSGPVHVMIELNEEPSTQAYAESKGLSASEADAASAAKSQLAAISQAQETLLPALTGSQIGAQVLYRVQRVYNGIAVVVDASQIAAIASLKGVKAVHPLVPKVLDNSSSVPLIGAPEAWEMAAGNGQATGKGVKIGILDTGVDYIHTDLGGPGTAAAYLTNDPTVVESGGAFPNAKVVGGYDFAGDDYNADPTSPYYQPVPHPDPDPMDCVGHGTHVAGTVAGKGVQANGTAFSGPYNSAQDFSSFKVGPGVAPEASLYALRIFGCQGPTEIADQAIEWAVDPNGDGDFSDHLDVINLSLSYPYGTSYDSTAVASNNAALAGVIVVAASGNEGDTYYVNSSPAVAGRAISVAASVDGASMMDGFEVTAPANVRGSYGAYNAYAFDWSKPVVEAGLVYIGESGQNTGCNTYSPANASLLAGKIVLQDWSRTGGGEDECDSTTRVNRAAAAGARGALLAYDRPAVDIPLYGSSAIPAAITSLTVGNTLKDALESGSVTVKLTSAHDGATRYVDANEEDLVLASSARGPSRAGSALKPDITAPGMTIFSAALGSGSGGVSLSGTSMAAAHIAGVMALLRQLHPTWTVEELKALVMDTAQHDLFTGLGKTGDEYGLGRVGAGRVDAALSAASQTVVFNGSDPGLVSVSFGAPEVFGSLTLKKTVKVENKGSTDLTYSLSITNMTQIPGVAFKTVNLSGNDLSSLSVPKGGSATFQVQMDADGTQMTHTRDATVQSVPFSTLQDIPGDRSWLSEASAYLTLTPGAGGAARLPIYAAPRPISKMSAPANLNVASGTNSFTLSGTEIYQNVAFGIKSVASMFELQEASADDPAIPSYAKNADLKYVGVTADILSVSNRPAAEAYFAIATQANWATPNEVEFDVYLDLNLDGQPDYVLFNTNYGAITGGPPSDVYLTVLCSLSSGNCALEEFLNAADANTLDTVLFNTNVMVLPVYLSDLGVTDSTTSFPMAYMVSTYNREVQGPIDSSGVHVFDPLRPGLVFTGGIFGKPAFPDRNGQSISFKADPAALLNAGSQGVLVLHHHNGTGNHEQVLNVNAVAVNGVGELWGSAGKKVTYSFYVTNMSQSADTFDVAILPGPAWATLASPPSIYSLAPYASAEVKVDVYIPASARAGDTDTASLQITSRGNSAKTSIVSMRTGAAYLTHLPVIRR